MGFLDKAADGDDGRVGRLVLACVLCVSAFVATAALHHIAAIYLVIIEYVELDLARLASAHREVELWRVRTARRRFLKERRPRFYGFTYFGTFWFCYAAAGSVLMASLLAYWLEIVVGEGG